jgi:hypothetical protein
MTARAVAMIAAASACASRPPLVTDVRIDGFDLVIERCPNPNNWFWRGCSIARRSLPVVAATYRAIGAARDALERCAATSAVHGLVRTRLAIDARGHTTAAAIEPDDPELARCTVAAFAPISFPANATATTLAFWFRVPERSPPPATP